MKNPEAVQIMMNTVRSRDLKFQFLMAETDFLIGAEKAETESEMGVFRRRRCRKSNDVRTASQLTESILF